MAKIPKNLTDKAMFEDYKEVETFETMFSTEEEPQAKPKVKGKGKDKEDLSTAFLTKELQEKIGKALLELKLELYKEGIVEYDIKVVREEKKILLNAVPLKKKKK
ncbi:hypothetical protein [Anaerosinus sp.]|uniref:hypothetical protein n=1 Tax=Selenobaculum sp. TaxID=3074374 RepID=UPI0015B23C35